MKSCCQTQYDHTFDKKYAGDNLSSYISDGVKKSSKPLLEAIRQFDLTNTTILEIGGGIGAIIFELFKSGATSAVNVDISKANQQVFISEVAKRGLEANAHAVLGDFVELHEQFEAADLVVMDKVICCYEDYRSLIDLSAGKAQKWYAFSMPTDAWWMHILDFLDNKWRAFKGKPFQTYVHPVKDIVSMLEDRGFRQVHRSGHREWLVYVFERKE